VIPKPGAKHDLARGLCVQPAALRSVARAPPSSNIERVSKACAVELAAAELAAARVPPLVQGSPRSNCCRNVAMLREATDLHAKIVRAGKDLRALGKAAEVRAELRQPSWADQFRL
jgi:hypothetical protein